ncbi:MAG: flagellar biosynthetic protein FliO [Pirellulaceae bacterium]
MFNVGRILIACLLGVSVSAGQADAQYSDARFSDDQYSDAQQPVAHRGSLTDSLAEGGMDIRSQARQPVIKASYISPATKQVAQVDSGFPTLSPPTETNQATATTTSSSSKSFGPLVTTGFSLVVVLGLFAGLVWVTRRYGNASMTQSGVPSDVMKSLGSTAIDARTRVTLLRCGNRIIVMAQTATGVHPLSEITDPAEVQRLTAMCNGETVSQANPTFADALRQANRRGGSVEFAG